MKLKFLYAALSLAIVGFLTIAAVGSEESGGPDVPNKKIIKFSHALHKDITDCASCHVKVPESTSLNDRLLPDHDVCSTCHDVEDTDNCKMCHYEDVNEPLIQKKPVMIFNHKMHINEQKLECEKCHKLDDAEYAFESPTAIPDMSICSTCHNSRAIAQSACETCHISTDNLIPQDHQEVGFVKSHKFKATAMDAKCEMCHDDNFCETCHASTTMITESNSARDFYTPYSPHRLIDNAKQQQITRVHDLNYQYTHGIDAKDKSTECQTCHQTETFCAQCHQSKGGDFAMEGIMPASHKKMDFVTIGVGTGGGLHAQLARRDMESCTSCHDVQGADPTCILCHVDPDGIKGTNPKTHTNSFMRSEDGDWHSDANSVCYQCHTDANARPDGIKGVGFCGYCHN